MLTSAPLVSVVIPSYNHRAFISQAIESVVKQSYPHIEIIVIDDSSSDGSMAVIERLADAYGSQRRFVVRHRPNKGAPATFNEGIGLASGSFVGMLNSDDYYATHRIALMVRSAVETGAEFIFSEVELINEGGRVLRSDWYAEGLAGALRYPTTSFYLLNRNFAMSTGNFFFSRDLYSKVGPFADLSTTQDWDFLLKSLAWTEPLFLRQKTYFYRFHETNSIRRYATLLAEESLRAKFNYLSSVSGKRPRNRLAPCFGNWGHFWTEFVKRELPDLVTRPEFQPILF